MEKHIDMLSRRMSLTMLLGQEIRVDAKEVCFSKVKTPYIPVLQGNYPVWNCNMCTCFGKGTHSGQCRISYV